jgi:hypothetical protein
LRADTPGSTARRTGLPARTRELAERFVVVATARTPGGAPRIDGASRRGWCLRSHGKNTIEDAGPSDPRRDGGPAVRTLTNSTRLCSADAGDAGRLRWRSSAEWRRARRVPPLLTRHPLERASLVLAIWCNGLAYRRTGEALGHRLCNACTADGAEALLDTMLEPDDPALRRVRARVAALAGGHSDG